MRFVSIIVPIFNEEDNLPILRRKLGAVMENPAYKWECLFVDDGSRDESAGILQRFVSEDPRFRAVHFRANYGQTAAMQAGFDLARGDVIVPIDGDLQNDPEDIANLLAKIEEGYDVVSGWRRDRKDKKWSRVFVSKVANRLVSAISGVRLHDYGCSLKCYRREFLKGVRLYGEMHRFIPVYASWQGAKVAEIPVRHHPRVHGKSNYGLERVFKVILDLMVVKFLHEYAHKPMYLFGAVGLLFLFFGGVFFAWALWLKFVEGVQLTGPPLPLLGVFMESLGVISILMGLLAELGMRTYFESQGKRTYSTLEQDGAKAAPSGVDPASRGSQTAAGDRPE